MRLWLLPKTTGFRAQAQPEVGQLHFMKHDLYDSIWHIEKHFLLANVLLRVLVQHKIRSY